MQGVTGVVVRDGVLTVEHDLSVKEPDAHEVRVKVLASGICRSDLALIEEPSPYPVVIGHEASGIVESVGSDITDLEVGQRVAVTCQRPCMNCAACARGVYSSCPVSMGQAFTPFALGDEPISNFARSSSMASHIVVDRMQVHPVEGIEPGPAALIGCAVSTGYGTARNVAKVQTGDVVVVVGVGGIGINSIQTSRLIGAKRVIAVDVVAGKEQMARDFGADDFFTITPGQSASEIADHLRGHIGEDINVFIDCTGQPSVVGAGVELLAVGGHLGLVGLSHAGVLTDVNINTVMAMNITIAGALNGGCNPFVDFSDILQLAAQGRLNLADQVTHHFPVEQVEEAIAMMKSGKALRVVLDFPA